MINEQDLKAKHPSCWKRRTRIEKYLLLLLAVLIITIIIILSIRMSTIEDKRSRNTCFTPDCIRVADQILQKIDLNQDPCDDFYKFSCGNFEKLTHLPDYKTSITSFSTVDDLVTQELKTLLGQPIEKSSEARPFILAKSIYQACMNTTRINANSLPVLKRLFEATGGWPVIEGKKWENRNFDWKDTSYQFMKMGFKYDVFFSFAVQTDARNSSRKILNLDQPFIVSFDKLLRKGFNESIVKAYYNYMVKAARLVGADEKRAAEEMKEVIDLLIAITRITVPPEERRDTVAETNPMTLRKLEEEFPYVPWREYVNTMLFPIKEMKYEDNVIVSVPKYFQKLESVLASTPKKTLANYMYWRVLTELTRYLNEDLRNLKLEFTKIASGRTERAPKWKECIDEASGLYAATGALFVRNFFNTEGKRTMLEMVANIREQFTEILKTVDWMDDVTRQHALEKAKAINVYIAYPDELLDDAKIEEYYKNLTVDPTKYLESIQNLTLFTKAIEFSELDMPVNKSDWRNHFYATITNAFYDENENSIEFPASILQGAFFDNDRPQYMNYGAIGYIIGHEVTHGFDDEGRQFDKHGNLVDWWLPKTKSAFDQKAQCIIDQYSNITVPEINIKLNGINTQGENIADNGGVKQAYLAYKKWAKEHGREPYLPGLPYTPEQMFWISVGNTWCTVVRKEQLKLDVMEMYHAPNYYRVNVPLMNSEDFARDFNCPLGSKMNPEKKCVVW